MTVEVVTQQSSSNINTGGSAPFTGRGRGMGMHGIQNLNLIATGLGAPQHV
jgi:hypothetical protein